MVKEENKKYIPGVVLVIVISIGLLYLGYVIIQDRNDDITEVVEGEIVEVKFLGHPPKGSGYYGDCDIFEITFDNGKQFTIATRTDLDLTVNSKFVMHFFKDNSNDLYWNIDRIIKIP